MQDTPSPATKNTNRSVYRQVKQKRRIRRAVQAANRRALMKSLLAGLTVSIIGFIVVVQAISFIDRSFNSGTSPANRTTR